MSLFLRYSAATLVALGLLAGCSSPYADGSSGISSGDYLSAFQVDQPPALLTRVAPTYPPRLQRLGLHGKVSIFFIVEQDGSVREAQAVNRAHPTEDDLEFEAAALAAIRQWRFSPGRKGGEPVRVALTVPFTFDRP